MTTWDNTDMNSGFPKRHKSFGLRQIFYNIDGISGDTGGALTTKLNHIYHANVQVEKDTGPVGYTTGLVWPSAGKRLS